MCINQLIRSVIIMGFIIVLTGCTTTIEQRQPAANKLRDFYGTNVTSEQEQKLLATSRIHFAFDCFNITPENKLVILAQAKKLLADPKLRVHIAGHTDEYGSDEYNLGLGMRRADAVAKLLEQKGISSTRITKISHGKKEPIAMGHDKDSCRLNRRAELYYEG